MPRPGDRRPLICDHAIALLAENGARALTHGAIDRAADLPKGSTSYYFRTREALISATIERIRVHSRAAMDAADPLPAPTVATASHFIAEQLAAFDGARRNDALAVFALLPEVRENAALRAELSGCLFSAERATALLGVLGSTTPHHDAADLIAFLSGLLFDTFFGVRSRPGAAQRPAAESVERTLRGLISTTR